MKRVRAVDYTREEFAEAYKDNRIVTFFSKSKDPKAKYLSNFQVVAEGIVIGQATYSSIEHRFQAAK